MTGKNILCLLFLIITAAAAYCLLRKFLSDDMERENRWAEYEHRRSGSKF